MAREAFLLKCLGVGDGWPSADRKHSSFLYQFGKASILVDCGEPCSSTFQSYGLSYDLIDRIFLSHLHFDHIGGFFMMVQACWLEQRKKDLTVHLPASGIEPITGLLKAACVFDELFTFRLHFAPLAAHQPVKIQNLLVTPFLTSHLASLKDRYARRYTNDYAAYSFLLESEGLRVAHTADIAAIEDLEPLIQKPLDLLVCELAHIDPTELCRYLRQKQIRRICFVHLGRYYWENFEHTRALAEQILGNATFTFARDGEEIRL